MTKRNAIVGVSDNPTSDANCLLTRTLTFLYLPAFNFYLLLFPRWLSFDWSMEAIPVLSHLLDARNLVSLAFYTGLCLIARLVARQLRATSSEWCSFDKSAICLPCSCACHPVKLQKKPLSMSSVRAANNNNVHTLCSCEDELLSAFSLSAFSTTWDADETSSCSSSGSSSTQSSSANNARHSSHVRSFSHTDRLGLSLAILVIPFIPATNLFFYVGFVVAERVLYMPSMGYCLFIAIGMESLMKRKTSRFITLIALSIILMSFAGRTFVRNIDWVTEEKLYESGIAINPPKGTQSVIEAGCAM